MLLRSDRGGSPTNGVRPRCIWRSAANRWEAGSPHKWLPAAIGELAGLVFLGYPLHPPGRPERLRAKHLSDIKAPMLFVQGSRDAFGTPDELRPIITRIEAPADLYVIEGGDHSFKVRKGMRRQARRYLPRNPRPYRRMVARDSHRQESAMSEAGTAPRSNALRASHWVAVSRVVRNCTSPPARSATGRPPR